MKSGLAQMAKGGIIMDVTNAQEARVAENAGVGFFIGFSVEDFKRVVRDPLCLSEGFPSD